MTKTVGLFLEVGCVRLGCVKLGLINYDNELPVHNICDDTMMRCGI